jgi:NAD(P)-dependent dehydrogenase (short-subunit alcohol dehydrogenase family)
MIKKRKRVAIITGSSGSIGSAIADAFSKNKYFVVGIDKKENSGACVDVFINQDLRLLTEDNKSRKQFRKKLYTLINDKILSVLVNNAAVQILGAVDEITPEDFIKSVHTNAVAPFILVQICLDKLKEAKGQVINIGSVHAESSKPEFTGYATSKAALAGLTRSLAIELGKWAIKVNCIQPGAVDTKMLKDSFANKPDKLKKLKECIPLGHIGQPEDIATLALFLAELQNSYISGSVITIDGGISSRLHDPE